MRVAKYALASMIFFAAASPVLAQDETEEASAVVAPLQEKSKKQTSVKKYPMKEISGKVVDAATGEPLAGVKLKSYNNSYYTAMTNEKGE